MHRVLDRHRAGHLECHVVRVDRMERTVHQSGNDIDHGIPGDNAALERLPDSLLDRWDELARDATLRDLVLEDEPAPLLAWPHVQLRVAELALAASLPHEAPAPLRRPLHRLFASAL